MKTVLQLSKVCSWPCQYSFKGPYIISFGSHDQKHTQITLKSPYGQSQHPILLVFMMWCALLVKLWFIKAITTQLDTNKHHRPRLCLVLTICLGWSGHSGQPRHTVLQFILGIYMHDASQMWPHVGSDFKGRDSEFKTKIMTCSLSPHVELFKRG